MEVQPMPHSGVLRLRLAKGQKLKQPKRPSKQVK